MGAGASLSELCLCLSEKWFYSERKEFAPRGSKFSPYRVDHFQKGRGMQ